MPQVIAVPPAPSAEEESELFDDAGLVGGRPVEDRSFEAVETTIGLAAGVAIGAAVAGPVGTAIGGLLGAAVGLAAGEAVERAVGRAATTTDATEPELSTRD